MCKILGYISIYEDSLYTNIIGEFSLKDFLKENQIRSPVVRTEYAEVQLVLVRHEQVINDSYYTVLFSLNVCIQVIP